MLFSITILVACSIISVAGIIIALIVSNKRPFDNKLIGCKISHELKLIDNLSLENELNLYLFQNKDKEFLLLINKNISSILDVCDISSRKKQITEKNSYNSTQEDKKQETKKEDMGFALEFMKKNITDMTTTNNNINNNSDRPKARRIKLKNNCF